MGGFARVLRERRERFAFNWKVTAFSAFFGVLFVNLGAWQLSRADEKRALIAAEFAKGALPPVSAKDWMDDEALAGRRILLAGQFAPGEIWLLDNKVLNGVVGFEVIQAFHDRPSATSFYVNRGFAAMGRTRADLPDVPAPEGTVEIVASAYRPTGETYRLDDAGSDAGLAAGPIVQVIVQAMSDLPPGEGMHPVTLRLAGRSAGALPRHWPVTNMAPEKHEGYALQWFTMAFAVAAMWLFFSFPKARRQAGAEGSDQRDE